MKNFSIYDELEEWSEKEDIDLNDLLIQIKDNYEEIKEIIEL
jgi:hypothetical protein|tara:strand:- start:1 stop:126 length:126 start_codon:yes stop_codon:yes gene_type:complete